MSRTFAQINNSLLRSRKIQSVSHTARWAYLCTHLQPLASFTGVSIYPSVLWERDSGLDGGEFVAAREALIATNLIEWSDEEELVRIVGHHRQRPPQNASLCVGLVTDFEKLLTTQEDTGIVLRAAAEFAVAAVAKSTTWKPESPEVPKVREVIGKFLRATCLDHESAFLDALEHETTAANKAVMREFEALVPALSFHRQHTLPTPCRDPADIPRPRRD